MQQDQGYTLDTSRHVLSDIANAERVLLHHAEASSQPYGGGALKQHAQQLITHLQQHAQQSQGSRATPRSEESNAHHVKGSTPVSLETLDASMTALRTVFDNNLLSELCAVLHSLYVRQARLNTALAPLAAPAHAAKEPAHHVDDDCMPVQEGCHEVAHSMNSAVNGMAAAFGRQSGNSAKRERQQALPHSSSAAPATPQQDADAQQAKVDSHHIAALRCVRGLVMLAAFSSTIWKYLLPPC